MYRIFSNHLTTLSESISVSHKSLLIPHVSMICTAHIFGIILCPIVTETLSVFTLFLQVYHSGCPWVSSQKHLINMALYKVHLYDIVNESAYQGCGNYKRKVIDYNYDYFTFYTPNCNFNYQLHLKMTITTIKDGNYQLYKKSATKNGCLFIYCIARE